MSDVFEKKGADAHAERESKKDSFWDLASMMPPRTRAYSSAPESRTKSSDLADIIIEADVTTGGGRENNALTDRSTAEHVPIVKRYIPPYTGETAASSPKAELEYEVQRSLIHKVRVYPWRNKFSHYESFVRAARTLRTKTMHTVAPRAPFFSYVPNYNHLSRDQMAWYLFWRTRTQDGVFLPTDYSYVLLRIYELIAIADDIGAEASRGHIIALWTAYRNTHTQLDKYVPNWICDISLLYQLPPPELSQKLFEVVMKHCTLKEFFIPRRGSGYYSYADIVIRYCSSYDYTKSKFYKESATVLFDEHIPRAIGCVMERLSSTDRIFSDIGLTDSHMSKETFVNAICGVSQKKRLEIDFTSFSETNDLRHTVGDMVKYCENKLRAYIGVKSRLSAVPLHIEARKVIDEYFEAHLHGFSANAQGKRKRANARAEEDEYSRLYDLPKMPFSQDIARQIEQESWQTTTLLTEAFDGEETVETAEAPTVNQTVPNDIPQNEHVTAATQIESLNDLPRDMRNFIVLAYYGDTDAQKRLSADVGLLIDTIAERINECALDLIGDVLLEDNENGGYSVISDYVECVEPLLQAHRAEKEDKK